MCETPPFLTSYLDDSDAKATKTYGEPTTTIKPLIHTSLSTCAQSDLCWDIQTLTRFCNFDFSHLPIISRCATNLDTFALASSLVVLFSTRESEWTWEHTRQSRASVTGGKGILQGNSRTISRKMQKALGNLKVRLFMVLTSLPLC